MSHGELVCLGSGLRILKIPPTPRPGFSATIPLPGRSVLDFHCPGALCKHAAQIQGFWALQGPCIRVFHPHTFRSTEQGVVFISPTALSRENTRIGKCLCRALSNLFHPYCTVSLESLTKVMQAWLIFLSLSPNSLQTA